MAYTTIDKPSDYFNTVLYTGNVSGQSITGVGFQPDFLWIKSRSAAYQHSVRDVIRGSTKTLRANDTNAEATQSDSVTSFDSDGFTLGADSSSFVNQNSTTYVAWNWLADNTTGSSNTDGDITSTVSANTTAGFSIVSYTGSGTSGDTVGHGLGATPSMVIIKNRDTTSSWRVWHKSIHPTSGVTKSLFLNTTSADTTTSETVGGVSSSTFTARGTSYVNKSGDDIIAYCFTEKQGYSKMGSYKGNGNANGTFVYTGFKPAFVIIKRTSTTGGWQLIDNKRKTKSSLSDNDPMNPIEHRLEAQGSGAEDFNSVYAIDFLSNGFKLRGTSAERNGSGNTFVYMTFAESPFVTSTGIPNNAR